MFIIFVCTGALFYLHCIIKQNVPLYILPAYMYDAKIADCIHKRRNTTTRSKSMSNSAASPYWHWWQRGVWRWKVYYIPITLLGLCLSRLVFAADWSTTSWTSLMYSPYCLMLMLLFMMLTAGIIKIMKKPKRRRHSPPFRRRPPTGLIDDFIFTFALCWCVGQRRLYCRASSSFVASRLWLVNCVTRADPIWISSAKKRVSMPF